MSEMKLDIAVIICILKELFCDSFGLPWRMFHVC